MSGQQVFISHSHSDHAWVTGLAEALRARDVSVWLDLNEIRPGDRIQERLETGLRESDVIVVVLSPENARSPYLLFEYGVALGLGKRLIPIVSPDLDPASIPIDLQLRQFLVRDSPERVAEAIAAARTADRASHSEPATTAI